MKSTSIGKSVMVQKSLLAAGFKWEKISYQLDFITLLALGS